MNEKVHNSTGNVFADLGLPNAQEHLAKANLAHSIIGLIRSAGLPQSDAAKRLGLTRSEVLALLRGDVRYFSAERLTRFAAALARGR